MQIRLWKSTKAAYVSFENKNVHGVPFFYRDEIKVGEKSSNSLNQLSFVFRQSEILSLPRIIMQIAPLYTSRVALLKTPGMGIYKRRKVRLDSAG